MIQLSVPEPTLRMHKELERVLDLVVYAHLDGCKNAQSNYWIDDIVRNFCSVWRPGQILESRAIPSAAIRYLNDRSSDDVIVRLLREYSYNLWASVPKTLSDGPSVPSHRAQHKHIADVVSTEEVLAALWRVLSTSELLPDEQRSVSAAFGRSLQIRARFPLSDSTINDRPVTHRHAESTHNQHSPVRYCKHLFRSSSAAPRTP
jgi:hypothetical protein